MECSQLTTVSGGQQRDSTIDIHVSILPQTPLPSRLPHNIEQNSLDDVVVQLLSHVRLFATPWTAARQASLSFTNSQSLLKLMSIESVMPFSRLILCYPLLLLPSVFPSIRVFSNELALRIRWPKYWSFSFNISPSNEYSGLISFRMDWFDPLAVQGTLKSLLQHHSSKASILQHSASFIIQLSHLYMTTGKTTALTMEIFVGKVMSLLLNRLSRFVRAVPGWYYYINSLNSFCSAQVPEGPPALGRNPAESTQWPQAWNQLAQL